MTETLTMNTKQAMAIIAHEPRSTQQIAALKALVSWRDNSPITQRRANAVLKAALQEKDIWEKGQREQFTAAIVPALEKKEVRQIRMTAELYEAVQREAVRAGISAQEFMRKAIEEKIERQR